MSACIEKKKCLQLEIMLEECVLCRWRTVVHAKQTVTPKASTARHIIDHSHDMEQ